MPSGDSTHLMSTAPHRKLSLLFIVLFALLALALWRLSLTYDLGYFLPAPTNAEQQVLVERLGINPGADLTFVQLPGRSTADAQALAASLRLDPAFISVWPDTATPELTALPPVLWTNRLLLGDLPASIEQWQSTLADRVADISTTPDDALLELMAADPALLSVTAITGLRDDFDPSALRNAQPPLLVLRAGSGAFDIDAQADTYAALQQQLEAAGIEDAKLYGSGIYSVELQQAVRSESIIFSLLASLALAALILWRFRSFATLLAAALPLAIGAVSGLLILSLVFDKVHGITLAFGFTLLGVALDYPLHLLTHQRLQAHVPTQRLWRTMRLGIFSTVIAYGAFLLSGTGGLMQLGLFASVGIGAAALATAYLDQNAAIQGSSAPTTQRNPTAEATTELTHGPWLLALAIALPICMTNTLFNDDLGALTPVPKATLAADSALRQTLGTMDLRHLIAIRGPDLENVLERTEALSDALEQAVSANIIHRYRSVDQLLPSRARQSQRRSRLQDPGTQNQFKAALETTVFTQQAFDAFTGAVAFEAARTGWLTLQDLQAEPNLAELLASQLYQSGNDWVSLIYLSGLQSPSTLAATLPPTETDTLVDLKMASVSLVQDYRNRLVSIISLAVALVGLMLWQRTGNLRRSIWLIGTMLAAVSVATLGNLLLGNMLSLFDLMALALVAGLGLDYALFFSRDDDQAQVDRPATRQAVLLCALSSLLVFGILSLSSIPLLKGIGSTVAIGVAAAWLLAWQGRYEKPAT